MGCYDPLHYVLMFLNGEQGWQAKTYFLNLSKECGETKKNKKKNKNKESEDARKNNQTHTSVVNSPPKAGEGDNASSTQLTNVSFVSNIQLNS
jgi:hypothetical protein